MDINYNAFKANTGFNATRDKESYIIPVRHNSVLYSIKIGRESNWPELGEKIKYDLIEYFKLCIDVDHLRGKLVIKT